MFPYVLIIGSIALIALFSQQRRPNIGLWSIAFTVLILFVGLRHNVGMDWNNYLLMIQRANWGSLAEAMYIAEPSYALMIWVSAQLGWGMYAPDVVVAIILMVGLFRYARSTPSPWIALLVALPFVVVVTGMSANRQAAAMGVLFWTMASWSRYSPGLRAALVVAAATFHASAIFFLLFIFVDLRIKPIVKAVAGAILVAVTFYYLEVTGKAEYYDQLYVSGQGDLTQSSGAIFHVLLNAGPALLYFAMRRYRPILLPNDVHRRMALLAVALIPLVFVASAASGRISLYLFPVSMHIFAAMPLVFHGTSRIFFRIACVAFFPALLIFWLLQSNTGAAYLPYRSLFTVDPALWQLCC